MLRFFRKSLLLLLIIVLGVSAGALLRFAFGRSLQWQSAARVASPLTASEKADTAHATVAAPAPIPAVSATLIKLNAIAARDYAALTRLLEEQVDGELEGISVRNADLLIVQLMELDPQRTLAWVRQHIFGRASESWAFTEWWRKSPAAAEAWATTNAPDMLQRVKRNFSNISKAELARLLKNEPAKIEDLLSQGRRQREVIIINLAEVRAEQNAADALTWARSLTHAGERESALQGVFRSWAKSDPRAAAAAWSSLPKGAAAERVLPDIAAALPKADALAWLRSLDSSPVVQKEIAQRLPDGEERTALIAALPESLAGAFRQNVTGEMNAALKAGPSPAAFAALAHGARSGARVTDEVGALYRAEPAGTLAALTSLPDGEFKNGAAQQVGAQFRAMPESEARQLLATLPEGPFRDAAAEQFAGSLSKFSPQQALEFLAPQSVTARGKALPEIMQHWLSQDAAAARSAWQALPETDQRAASAALAEKIADRPNAENMALFSTLPDIPAETWKQAAQGWVGRSPELASEWVNALPLGPGRDAAVGGMVDSLVLAEWDPSRAIVWAGTIADKPHRLTTLRTTLELWSLRDPAAADAARQLLPTADQQALATP